MVRGQSLSSAVNQEPLPLIPKPAQQFRCAGSHYLNNQETTIVAHLVAAVQPRVVFEFGVNRGLTAKAILDHVPSIELYVGVDVPPDHDPTLACQRTEVPRFAALAVRPDPRFKLLMRDSRTLVAEELEPIDAAFIDGDHSREGVEHDSRLARELLRPGGVIVWHDYGNGAVEVTEVLDKLRGEGWPLEHVEGTWLATMRA